MPEEERPVHVIFDCAKQEYEEVPVSDEEWEEMKKISAQAAQDAADQEAEEARIKEMVNGHPDPLVQVLAKRAGLV